MNYALRTVDRRAQYFARSANHRASDSYEYSRRFRKGEQIQQDIQKTSLQRAFEKALPVNVTPLARHRA